MADKLKSLFSIGVWQHTVTATEAAESIIWVNPNSICTGARYIIPTSCATGDTNKLVYYDNSQNLMIVFGMRASEAIQIPYVAIMNS